MTTTWAGRLFLDAGAVVYIGPGGPADRHAHHAVQLVWAEDGELMVTIEQPVQRRAVLIPADVPHAFDATGRHIALLLVDPHSARGASLDRRARLVVGQDVANDLPSRFPPRDVTAPDAARWSDAALAALGAARGEVPLSAATRRAITYIEEAIDGVPRLADAARRIGISPTRLTHVFSQEVGIPFRRFVLWTRVKRAVEESRTGADLTRAAVAAGFSDSAHLSRTFRSMFGLSPSMVLPHVEIVGSVWTAGA